MIKRSLSNESRGVVVLSPRGTPDQTTISSLTLKQLEQQQQQ